MFNKLLVLALVTVAFARPDVSHLKTVEYKSPVTSYDVPINAVDNKYVTNYYRYGQQNVPTVTYLPPFIYNEKHQTSGNIVPTLISNAASGQYGLLGQYGTSQGGQGHYVYGTGSGNKNQGIHFVTQGEGVGHQGTHFVTQQGQGVGQHGVNFVTQQGQGSGQQGTTFVTQQGQGSGHQGTQFVTQQGQGVGQGVVTTQFVSQPVHHEVVNTQFVSQPVYGSGQQQILDTQYVTQGQNAGQINVAQGAGFGQQQYVKDEQHVYYFSAPEELQHKTRLRINVVPTHSKKTNVIFVNAPSSPQVIPEVVVPPHQIIEDKTKVIVLVKEHDQFVPISVPAPLPINQGKAEVFVVKYNDKNDAERIVSSTGRIHGSPLTRQDKPSFVNNLNENIVKHKGLSNTGSGLYSRFGSEGGVSVGSGGNAYGLLLDGGSSGTSSYGTQSIKLVDTTPSYSKSTSTYSYGNQGAKGTEGVINAALVGTGGSSGNVKTSGYEVKTVKVASATPSVGSYGIQNLGSAQTGSTKGHYATSAQQQSGVGNLNFLGSTGSNAGGKQVNTYEVKTVESVKNTPSVATYEIKNFGDEYHTVNNANQGSLGARFSGDVDGPNQSGYTIQTTEFVKNIPSSETVGYDNIEQIRKILGQSGQGIELVSISKGTLEGSGPQAQESFFKSLGLDNGSFNAVGQDGNSFLHSLQINENAKSVADLPLQSRSGEVNSHQIQIGNDVAEVISASSLIS